MSELVIRLPELHAKQQEVKDDPARFKVLVAGRRFGKNITEHDYVMDGLLAGEIVGWGSPTYKNMTEDWRTLRELAAPITSRALEQERRIECITGGVLEMWSLDSPDPIRGRKYHRFVINEAGFVPYLLDTWKKIIRSTLIDFKGRALIAGTPNGMNDYHTIYGWGLGGQAEWKSFHFTSLDNPYMDRAEIESQGAPTEREYQQEVMAEFVQNEGAVFRNLAAALTAPSTTPDEHKDHTIVAGHDWGKVNDFSANSLACVECQREVYLERYNQIDYHFQVQRLEDLYYRWKVKRGRVELNSIGQVTFEMLVRKGLPVIGFDTTAATKGPLIEGLSLDLERGTYTLLGDDVGKAELQAYEARRTKTGHTQYDAPPGFHDDTIIARALARMQMRETPVPDPKRQARQREMADARKVLFG